jgi:hypothetical protein
MRVSLPHLSIYHYSCRHQFHGIDYLWEINSVVELIPGDVDYMCRNWRFQNCRRYMLCVGEGHPYYSISNPQTIWRLFAGSIPALKINNVWDMAYSVPHLVPQMLQEESMPPMDVSSSRRLNKNKVPTGSVLNIKYFFFSWGTNTQTVLKFFLISTKLYTYSFCNYISFPPKTKTACFLYWNKSITRLYINIELGMSLASVVHVK